MAPAFALLTRCRQTPGARALVHCEHGISRSVSVAAAYLLEHPDALHPPLPLRASVSAPMRSGQATLAMSRPWP